MDMPTDRVQMDSHQTRSFNGCGIGWLTPGKSGVVAPLLIRSSD